MQSLSNLSGILRNLGFWAIPTEQRFTTGILRNLKKVEFPARQPASQPASQPARPPGPPHSYRLRAILKEFLKETSQGPHSCR